jgi:hypothetical protein
MNLKGRFKSQDPQGGEIYYEIHLGEWNPHPL